MQNLIFLNYVLKEFQFAWLLFYQTNNKYFEAQLLEAFFLNWSYYTKYHRKLIKLKIKA